MRTAIRKHSRDFVAVIALVVVALVVGGYILSHQRFYLPELGAGPRARTSSTTRPTSRRRSRSRRARARRSTIAGVDVGEIAKVDLQNGRAVVTMKIRRKYTPIYKKRDGAAAAQDRPQRHDPRARPGHEGGRAGAERLRDPDRPDRAERQLRRVPRRRWTATRATTCSCCSRRRGRALGGQRQAALRRRSSASSRPARDLARLNGALAQRDAQHPPRDPQLQPAHRGARRQGRPARRAGRLLQPRLPRLRRPGREPARGAAACCPGRCRRRTRRSSKVDELAHVLGPTLRRLRPGRPRAGAGAGADAPVPAPDDADHQEQLRPFAREALPVAKPCARRRATWPSSRRSSRPR